MKAAIDTMVLQKSNAEVAKRPRENSRFVARIRILKRATGGDIVPLYSARLIQEYRRQVPTPRNDSVRAFLDGLERNGILNWKNPWTGTDRDNMRSCRFPGEDEHVLRTAATHGERTHLISEENRILTKKTCVKRKFNVAIVDVPEVDR
jgi:hypothetical protein